jgi:hypothetical protein
MPYVKSNSSTCRLRNSLAKRNSPPKPWL